MSGTGSTISSMLENHKNRRQETEALLSMLSQRKKEHRLSESLKPEPTQDKYDAEETSESKMSSDDEEDGKNRILSDGPSEDEQETHAGYEPPAAASPLRTALPPVAETPADVQPNTSEIERSSNCSGESSGNDTSEDENESTRLEHTTQTRSPPPTSSLLQIPPQPATTQPLSVSTRHPSLLESPTATDATIPMTDSATRVDKFEVDENIRDPPAGAYMFSNTELFESHSTTTNTVNSQHDVLTTSSTSSRHVSHTQTTNIANAPTSSLSRSSTGGTDSRLSSISANSSNQSIQPSDVVAHSRGPSSVNLSGTAAIPPRESLGSSRDSTHSVSQAQQYNEEVAAIYAEQKTRIQDDLMSLARAKYSMSETLVTLYHSETTLNSNAHSFQLNISNQISLLKQLLDQREEYLLQKIEEIKTQHEHEIVDARAKISHCVDTLQHIIMDVGHELNNVTLPCSKADFITSNREQALQENISQRMREAKNLENEVTTIHNKVRHPQLGIQFSFDAAFQACRAVDLASSSSQQAPATPGRASDSLPSPSAADHISADIFGAGGSQHVQTTERAHSPVRFHRRPKPTKGYQTQTPSPPRHRTSSPKRRTESPTRHTPTTLHTRNPSPAPHHDSHSSSHGQGTGYGGTTQHQPQQNTSTGDVPLVPGSVPSYMQPTISNMYHQHYTLQLHANLLESKTPHSYKSPAKGRVGTPTRQRASDSVDSHRTSGRAVHSHSPSAGRRVSRRHNTSSPSIPSQSPLPHHESPAPPLDISDVDNKQRGGLPGGHIPREKRFHGTFSPMAGSLPSGVFFTSDVPNPGPGAYNTSSVFATATPTSSRGRK